MPSCNLHNIRNVTISIAQKTTADKCRVGNLKMPMQKQIIRRFCSISEGTTKDLSVRRIWPVVSRHSPGRAVATESPAWQQASW